MLEEFTSAVKEMQAGNVIRAAHTFARCCVQVRSIGVPKRWLRIAATTISLLILVTAISLGEAEVCLFVVYGQAQVVLARKPDDADPEKVAAIEETLFECLVYRAACLQACQNYPAAKEAKANLERAVNLAKKPDATCQVGHSKPCSPSML